MQVPPTSLTNRSTDFGSFKNRKFNAAGGFLCFLRAQFASSPHKRYLLQPNSCCATQGSLRKLKSGTRTKRRGQRKGLQPFLLRDHCCDYSLKRSGPLGR